MLALFVAAIVTFSLFVVFCCAVGSATEFKIVVFFGTITSEASFSVNFIEKVFDGTVKFSV